MSSITARQAPSDSGARISAAGAAAARTTHEPPSFFASIGLKGAPIWNLRVGAFKAPETAMAKPRTLYDKIWDDHLIETGGGASLIYIDRHLVHEVTSPQAFEGLRMAGRKVRAPEKTLALVDHKIHTTTQLGKA